MTSSLRKQGSHFAMSFLIGGAWYEKSPNSSYPNFVRVDVNQLRNISTTGAGTANDTGDGKWCTTTEYR
jgi:hypothetical protein